MKILIYTDCHFCQYSSIVRRRGQKYSQRLENLIQSIDWAEDLAIQKNCDQIICLGDFFDKPSLCDEELTALQDIKWVELPHYFVVGNHESSVSGLRYNSVSSLQGLGFNVISEPITCPIDETSQIVFIPYITEDNRKPLSEYITAARPKTIIMSHNDVKGIQYGKITSPNGFSLEEINDNCALFLNGHLHNGMKIGDHAYNLGNLTGQNFGEDASKYAHQVVILDTETLELQFIENPYAYNFYKLEVDKKTDLNKMFSSLKKNSIIAIKCLDKREQEVRDFINLVDYIPEKLLDYRITTYQDDNEYVTGEEVVINNVDHLEQFKSFILDNLGSTNIVKEELHAVCGG